jgi:hypothetical protein
MTFCSPFAVIEFGVPPTASHKNNFAKLVGANALAVSDGASWQLTFSAVQSMNSN